MFRFYEVMQKSGYYLIFLSLVCFFYACKPKEEIVTKDKTAKLRFSADTVRFDTVFTGMETVTHRLKVYNKAENAVEISQIWLGGMNQSPFSLTINGINARKREDMILRGKDSMLVLVKAHIDPADETLPYLIKDSVMFTTNQNDQQVNITAWGQDAHYHKNDSISNAVTWTKGKPYVIFNTFNIKEGATLTMEPGTRVYFGNNAGMNIQGTLHAEGTPEDSITFCGIRLEERYKHVPGQWNGITFRPGSNGNVLRHTIIKNAGDGILIEGEAGDFSELAFRQSVIKNMSGSGIHGRFADLTITNSLITNCAVHGLEGTIGDYVVWNCTIANYSFDFRRDNAGVYFSDLTFDDEGNEINGMLDIDITNSIFWGSMADELVLELGNDSNLQQFLLRNNLVKTTSAGFDHASGNNFLINADTLLNTLNYPQFINYQDYNFRLDSISPAINKGMDLAQISEDIEGKARSDSLDLGCYESDY